MNNLFFLCSLSTSGLAALADSKERSQAAVKTVAESHKIKIKHTSLYLVDNIRDDGGDKSGEKP